MNYVAASSCGCVTHVTSSLLPLANRRCLRDEGKQLCKLSGGQQSWTVNIPVICSALQAYITRRLSTELESNNVCIGVCLTCNKSLERGSRFVVHGSWPKRYKRYKA